MKVSIFCYIVTRFYFDQVLNLSNSVIPKFNNWATVSFYITTLFPGFVVTAQKDVSLLDKGSSLLVNCLPLLPVALKFGFLANCG